MIEMRKLSLPNFWPFSIFLAILIGFKNHGVLKIALIKIQFYYNIFNLTNPDISSPINLAKSHVAFEIKFNFITQSWPWPILNFWQIVKLSLQWSWTWTWMWPQFPILWFNSIFNLMLTPISSSDFDHNREPILIPIPINLEHEPPILKSHIPLMKNDCETRLFDLDPTIE